MNNKECMHMMAPITGTANIDKVLTEGDVILGFPLPGADTAEDCVPWWKSWRARLKRLFMVLM